MARFPLTHRTSRAHTRAGDRYTLVIHAHADGSFGWEVLVNGLSAVDRDEDWVKGGIEANRFAAFMAGHAALGVIGRKELL